MNLLIRISEKRRRTRLAAFATAACLAIALAGGCARTPEAKKARFLASGKKHLEKKDYQRALLDFKNAARVAPKDPDIFYQLGVAYLGAGDVRSALGCFNKALQLNPKHVPSQVKMAELLASTFDREVLAKAEEQAEAVLTADPENVDALTALALAQWKLGKVQDAEQHLRDAFTKRPNDLNASIGLAKMRLAQKDFKGAEEVLTKAASDSPTAENLSALGEFYALAGKRPEAEVQFRRALEIDKNNPTALIDLAAVQVGANRMQEADETYKRLAALPDKRYRPAHALFLYQNGKTAAATAEFEKLYKQDSEDRGARSRLVAVYLAGGKKAQAEAVLAKALKKNSKDVDALLQRAKIYITSREYDKAENDLHEVASFKSDSAEAHYLLATTHRERGNIMSEKQELGDALRLDPHFLRARLALAKVHLASNAPKAALDLLEEAPGRQKQTPPVTILRNWALVGVGRAAEVRTIVDRMLATQRIPEVLLQDATLRMLNRDFVKARAAAEEMLKTNPEDIRAIDVVIRSYQAQKNLPAALARIRELAVQRPKSAQLQMVLAQLLLLSGNRAQARATFQAAKAADPQRLSADLALARMDFEENNLEASRAQLKQILSRQKNATASLLLASVEQKAGHIEPSMEQYRNVLAVEPNNVLALNNLAFLLSNYGNNPDEALGFAERAKELAPDDASVENTIGWVLYRKGLYTMAIRHLSAADTKQPSALRKYHLGMAYVKAGEPARGRELLRTAIKLDPNLPDAQAVREMLAMK